MGVRAPLPRNFFRTDRPQRLRHLAVGEKGEHHAVPRCRMRRNRRGASYFIVRMGKQSK
jgi:hypothetical protein